MTLLLNPRVWIALVLAVGLGISHFTAYRSGKAAVRAEWDADKVRQVLAQREADELAVQTANQAAIRYEQAKKRIRVVPKELNHALEINRPWADVELPRELRDAIAAAGKGLAASEPDGAVRVPDPASDDQRALGASLRPGAGEPGRLCCSPPRAD